MAGRGLLEPAGGPPVQRRAGYQFGVNPSGSRRDVLIYDDGGRQVERIDDEERRGERRSARGLVSQHSTRDLAAAGVQRDEP